MRLQGINQSQDDEEAGRPEPTAHVVQEYRAMREKLLDEGTLLPSAGQNLKLKGDDEDAAMGMMHLLLHLASILKLPKFAERTRKCLKVLRETLGVKTKDLTGEHPSSRHIMQRMDN